MKTFSDLFRLDDGDSNLGSGWREFAGPAWVQDNAVGLSTGVTNLVYLTRETMDSLEHRAQCSFRLTAAKAAARVGLMVRAEWTDASPDYIHRCYLVTLDGTGAIAIYSILTSDPAPAPIATGTCDLDVSRAHKLMVRVRDADRSLSIGANGPDLGAQIDVYLDDVISPVLTTMDQRTLRPEGRYVGFDIEDTDGTETVTLGEFYAYVGRSMAVRNPLEMPRLDNFGDLIYETQFRLDRAGNSQFNDQMIGRFINRAHEEVFRLTHPWTWAFKITHFTTREGVRCYELPPYVSIPASLADMTNARILDREGWKDMRRLDPGDEMSNDYPWNYQVLGIGDFGGPVIALKPIPNGEYFIELPYYANPVPMVETTDMPILPPKYNEILVYGALKRAASYSDAKTLYTTSTQDFDRMGAQMVREDIAGRDQDFVLRFRSDQSLKRLRNMGSCPFRVTRYWR